MHEQATLQMIAYKLSKERDPSRVKKILVCELEIHEPEHFKKMLREFLRKEYPQVNAEIEITSPLKHRGITLISE